tara:strand:- start:23 stop:193 length:171 start_codon:yes stop_codon:yes gene_type:complete
MLKMGMLGNPLNIAINGGKEDYFLETLSFLRDCTKAFGIFSIVPQLSSLRVLIKET